MDLQEIVCSMYIIKDILWGQKLEAKKLCFLPSIYAAESSHGKIKSQIYNMEHMHYEFNKALWSD